jgi:hypothetical protein
MKLIDAVKGSNCGTVRWRDKNWTLCYNYDGDIDFIWDGGEGWYDLFLSQVYVKGSTDFEPVMKGDD